MISATRKAPIVASLLLAFSLVGCSSDDEGEGGSEAADLYGMAVGSRWVYDNYDHTVTPDPQVTDLVKEITGCQEITFVDCETGDERTHNAYVQETTGGNISAANPRDEVRKLYMIVNSSGLVRVKQDFIYDDVLDHYVTYSPYFVRIPAGPYEDDKEWRFAHERCEYAADDTERGRTPRDYEHVIVNNAEAVSVPAGTFETVHIARTDMGDGDLKRYWYEPGIGKVQEKGYLLSGQFVSEESLKEFTAGSGTCD